jgi:hypothetical protein
MRPQEPSIAVPNGTISRRKMLKRVGAGAAIAWSAPVLMSIQAPAYAQASPTCEVYDCLKEQRCGEGPGCPAPGCEDFSKCALMIDNSCICVQQPQCSFPDCTSDADCEAQLGPGWRCGKAENCACPTGCFFPCPT